MKRDDAPFGETVLVLGGTSDIGRAISRRLAAEVSVVQLAGRNATAVEREAHDIRVRGDVEVTTHQCDVLQPDGGLSMLDTLHPLPDVAICVIGALADQREAERDPGLAETLMRTNYVGPSLLLGALAERFADRGGGVLVGISSVAGDRGRKSNYVYGSAKAGFTAFLSGLRGRLAGSGVHVVTVKPGFVYSRMTDGMDLPPWLTAEPAAVAEVVASAVRKRRDVVYAHRRWRLVMSLVRAVPERLFKRLSI